MPHKTTTVESLAKLLPIPTSPVGLARSWSVVEAELRTSLPSDYKLFIDRYGDGSIFGSALDYGWVNIWSFRAFSRAQSAQSVINSVIAEYDEARSQGNDIPFPGFPEPGGLLPFAVTSNGDYFNWLTIGEADKWDVVFYNFDEASMVRLVGKSMTATILELLEQKSDLVPRHLAEAFVTPPYSYRDVGVG